MTANTRARFDVSKERLEALRDDLLRDGPEALEDAAEGNGRDGTVFSGEVQGDGLSHRWYVWTAAVDNPLPRHNRYCTLLLDCIVEQTTDAALRELVAEIRRDLPPLRIPD